MNIAICDDEKICQKQLIYKLKDYMERAKINNYRITTYASGIDLINEYRQDLFDFIFMDVDMPKLDGFNTAERIRRLDLNVDIVFVTRMSGQIYMGYSYNAKGYLCKPITEEQINTLMDRLLNERSRRQGNHRYNIRLKGSGAEFDLNLAEVIYFESKSHDICVMTKTGDRLAFRGQLTQVEIDLKGRGFVRVHQSYLVNMYYVFVIISKRVIFKEDYIKLEIPLSRKYNETAKKDFDDYKGWL